MEHFLSVEKTFRPEGLHQLLKLKKTLLFIYSIEQREYVPKLQEKECARILK